MAREGAAFFLETIFLFVFKWNIYFELGFGRFRGAALHQMRGRQWQDAHIPG